MMIQSKKSDSFSCKICGSKEHLAFPNLCDGCYWRLKCGFIPVSDEWLRFDVPMKKVDWKEDKVLADLLVHNLINAPCFYNDDFSEINKFLKKFRDS